MSIYQVSFKGKIQANSFKNFSEPQILKKAKYSRRSSKKTYHLLRIINFKT